MRMQLIIILLCLVHLSDIVYGDSDGVGRAASFYYGIVFQNKIQQLPHGQGILSKYTLVCSHYQYGDVMFATVREMAADYVVYVALVSKPTKDDSVCLITTKRLTAEEISTLDTQIDNVFVSFVPLELILSESVLRTVESRATTYEQTLNSIHVEVAVQHERKRGAVSDGIATQTVANVKRALDTPLKVCMRDDTCALHRIVADEQFLSNVGSRHEPVDSSIWRKALDTAVNFHIKETQNFDMCDFTHIEYIPFSTNISGDYSFRLVITDSLQNAQMAGPEGLHARAKEVDTSCLVHILAVLMMTENVEYITIATETTHANLYSAQLIEGGSTSAGAIYTDAGLNGSGVVVGIADTGLDVHSCYFSGQSGETAVSISSSSSPFTDLSKRKVVQYVADADDTDGAAGHGTHVVGTLAGHIPTASPSNSPYNGIATGAKVAMFDCAKASWNYLRIPSLYDEVFPAAASAGGTLHSNSWINNIYSYDTATVDADRYLYDNPMFLAFFAAGNSGPDAGTISAPSVSKNAVAVGSTGTGPGAGEDTVSSFSSRGPTIDGRFGIDVVTQGRSVQSSRAFGYATESCSTMVKSGTSMATPAAAGAAALITQYFQDSNFWAANCNPHFPNCPDGNDPVIGFTPSGSLVKAVLLHSGRDLGGGYAFPGNEQGFGRIDLSSVLLVKGVSDGFDLFVEDFVLLSMQERSIFVNVTSCDGRSFIKVSIGWMDVPNFIAVNKQLVHDVDLVVYGPVKDHMKWKGNNNSDGDDLNNVEMVYIQDPVCGMYEIVISGSLFLSPSDQRVSLVLTTSAGGFEIIDGEVSDGHSSASWLSDNYAPGVVSSVLLLAMYIFQV